MCTATVLLYKYTKNIFSISLNIFQLSNKVHSYLQEALAICFEKEVRRLDSPECYFNKLRNELVAKRDTFIKILTEAEFKPTIPEGSTFVIADWSNWGKYNNWFKVLLHHFRV